MGRGRWPDGRSESFAPRLGWRTARRRGGISALRTEALLAPEYIDQRLTPFDLYGVQCAPQRGLEFRKRRNTFAESARCLDVFFERRQRRQVRQRWTLAC